MPAPILQSVAARLSMGLLSAALAVAPSPWTSIGQGRGDRHVVIVTPDESDGRFAATREALAFWNQTLSELKLRPRLLEAKVLVAPPISRRLEAYTRQIWLLAGRSVPEGAAPIVPRELVELEGDVIVFLSRQVIFSFAWLIAGRTRYFLGIQTDTEPPLTYPNVTRNVIAHEIGHALGLEHNGNTATLMCGPCQHSVYRSDQPSFLSLTSAERERLAALHERAE